MSPSSRPAVRRRLAWLFVGVLAVYLFTAAGQFQTVDAAQELGVATSIRHGNGFRSEFPLGAGGGTTLGRGGGRYAGHDIGSSLLYLPVTLIPGTAEAVAAHPRSDATASTRQVRPSKRGYFAASFLPPVLGALIVVVFALLLDELGIDKTSATLTALALAFTTTIWVYAHVSFDSTATALAVIVAAWMLARWRRSPRPMVALAVGVALGAGVLVRVDTLVMVPFLVAPILFDSLRPPRLEGGRRLRSVLGAVGPVVIAVAVDLAYNWYRFGSIADNGHADDGFLKFNPRIIDGFIGQTISPGKGLLVFSPLVLVALFRWRWFLRRHTAVAAAFASACLATLLAHSAIVGWAGDQAWGARFTVPVVPLLLVPLARIVEEIRHGRVAPLARLATWGLAIVGFAIQLAGVLVDFFAVVTARRLRGDDTTTSLTHPGYLDGLAVLINAIGSAQPYRDLSAATIASLHVARLDLWWVRAAQVSGWNILTVAVPILVIGVALWAFAKLASSLRTAT